MGLYNENNFFTYNTLQDKVITFHDISNNETFGLNICNFQKAMTEGAFLWITMFNGVVSLQFGDETAAKLAHNFFMTVVDQLVLNCDIDLVGVSSTDHGSNIIYVTTVGSMNPAKGDIINPYTLSAGVTAAVSGDTIIVLPGTYSDSSNLLKNGVDIHFEPNTVVSGFHFRDLGVACVSTITGYGEFINNSANNFINVSHASSNVKFEFNSITSFNSGTFDASAGYLKLKGKSISETFQYMFYITGTGIMDVDVDLVTANTLTQAGCIYLDSHCIDSVERVCNFNIRQLNCSTNNFPTVRWTSCNLKSVLNFTGNITNTHSVPSSFNWVFMSIFNPGGSTLRATGRFTGANTIFQPYFGTGNFWTIKNSVVVSSAQAAVACTAGWDIKITDSYLEGYNSAITSDGGSIDIRNSVTRAKRTGVVTTVINNDAGTLLMSNVTAYTDSVTVGCASVGSINPATPIKLLGPCSGTFPMNANINNVITGYSFVDDLAIVPTLGNE